jgi:hypothetical protein
LTWDHFAFGSEFDAVADEINEHLPEASDVAVTWAGMPSSTDRRYRAFSRRLGCREVKGFSIQTRRSNG